MSYIVVIDDDRLVLDSVAEILAAHNFEVATAQNSRTGMQLIRHRLPDVIICDIVMPDLSGYEFLERVRRDPKTTSIPFIFLTARHDRNNLRRGMELGADDYISKPFRPVEIVEAVRAQLRKRERLSEKYESTLNLLRKNITYALPHELRTPLMGILGYAELLSLESDALSPQGIEEIAQEISASGKRLNRVLENYLVYAQIEILASDPVQVAALRNHVVRNAAEIIRKEVISQARQVGREADLTLSTENLALQISDDDLQKIIGELVGNAFKFSSNGTPVTVTSNRIDNHYMITIRDQGRGMTQEQIKNIGAYMQFGRLLHEQQGLGLGLVIAKRLVEFHRGECVIDSTPGSGTQITIRFSIYG